jgi:hypothetical protein
MPRFAAILFAAAQIHAVTDVSSYIDYIQTLALNESIMTKYGDYFDKRQKLSDTHFAATGR